MEPVQQGALLRAPELRPIPGPLLPHRPCSKARRYWSAPPGDSVAMDGEQGVLGAMAARRISARLKRACRRASEVDCSAGTCRDYGLVRHRLGRQKFDAESLR